MRRSVSLMLGAAAVGISVGAHAGPAPVNAPTPTASAIAGAKPAIKPVFKPASKPKKPEPPPLPAPQVELRIEPRPANGWVMSVRNTGEVPLEIVADARLLRFELVPTPSLDGASSIVDDAAASKPKPGAKKKGSKPKSADDRAECALPTSMRSDARRLVLAPGARYLEEFDPRLYCLDLSSKLGEGTAVFARLGWAPPKSGKLATPFVVVPKPTSGPAMVAAAKELAAPTVVVPAKASVVGSLAAPSKVNLLTGAPLVVHPGGARSFFAQKDAQLTVRLRNESSDAHVVYARPQLVGGKVRSPNGTVTVCDGWARPAPIVDFVVHLAPKGEWAATVGLDDLCPPGTFDRPGLYEVTPTLHADAIPWAPTAVTGALTADTPALVRIEEGKLPFHSAPPLALQTSE